MKQNLQTIILILTCFQISHAQYTFNQIDVWTGSSGSTPKYLTEHNGEFYFQAFEITPSFKKLYKSNGTESGTVQVAPNLNSGAGYSPESLTVFNGELYFTAFVTGLGIELYKTDGTETGTSLIKDIRPGGSSGLDQNTNNDKNIFVEFNGELYFRASTNTSIELWKTNGTEAGTVAVKNFEDTTNGAPQYSTDNETQVLGIVFNNALYFSVNRGGVFELWKTDGTTSGTIALKTNFNDPISNFIVFNNELLFSSSDGVYGNEIWKTDGTISGTQMKHDIFPNDLNPSLGKGSNPENFIIYQGQLIFTARSYDYTNSQLRGRELYKSDGTSATLIKEIKSGLSSGLPSLPRFTIYNNELLFLAEDDTTTDLDLWKTDATETGTAKLVSAVDTGETFQFSKPTLYNNKLLYHNFQQLWVTDGTDAGTEQLTNMNAGSNILQTQSLDLLAYNNKLWFSGFGSTTGNELTCIEDLTLSIDLNQFRFEVSTYPNPVKDRLYINSNAMIKHIEIYSTIGQKVLETYNSHIVDLSSLKSGYYIVKIASLHGVKSTKIIKL